MSYGSTIALDDAMDDYREKCAELIAHEAAKLVAARDMGREEAINEATVWLRCEIEAAGDVTGVRSIENRHPKASKFASSGQVKTIARELMDLARAVAATL